MYHVSKIQSQKSQEIADVIVASLLLPGKISTSNQFLFTEKPGNFYIRGNDGNKKTNCSIRNYERTSVYNSLVPNYTTIKL